jgi:hypothetical protein
MMMIGYLLAHLVRLNVGVLIPLIDLLWIPKPQVSL